MTTPQLQKIFSKLPKRFINDFKEENFQTCWYGSAGLDTKLLDYFSNGTPDSLLAQDILDKNPVRVYFFTDNAYHFDLGNNFMYLNQHFIFENGISSQFQYKGLKRSGICIGSLMFANEYSAKLVSYVINQETVYCFYISIEDSQFEQLIISNDLKIDVASHAGGWAGDGPILLSDLGVKFYLGNYPRGIEQVFNVEIINNNVSWGLCGWPILSCSFYRIIN